MFGDKRVEKKKTPIYKCNLNPIFNASFEFDVPWEQIRDCAIDVQVMDFDTIGRNELIGKILLACKFRIGEYSTRQKFVEIICFRNQNIKGRFYFLYLYTVRLPIYSRIPSGYGHPCINRT